MTARGSNKVLKFDTNALRTDPNHALLDSIATGPSPVGISTFGEDGSHLLVANSDRFNPNASASTAVVIDTGTDSGESPTITQTIATGSFPREITESADHNYLFLTNYKSGEIQIIPEDELIP